MGDVYRALADPTRRAILDALFADHPQTLFELRTRLIDQGMVSTRQAVSQHLAVLEEAGLVRSRREGRYTLLEMDPSPLTEIIERWRKT
jgi:DNA-binding transcriptional ArsR family regulator